MTEPSGILCPQCQTRSVHFLREDPMGIRLYQCTSCLEVKRSCPRCNEQGWLEHFVVTESPYSRYICDECASVWTPSLIRLDADGVIQSALYGSELRQVWDMEVSTPPKAKA